jgi:CubicO group peptidase (beta-lactamase class C family)
MLARFILSTVAFILLVNGPALGQSLDVAAVDSIVEQAMKAWKIPGAAVVIVRGHEVIYLKGHGVKELGKSDPVTPDTLFAIASTSKAFTATAVALLVDDGRMHWDDPVRKHIEYFRLADPLADQNITIRDLLCHRSGLSRNDLLWYNSAWDREDIMRRVGQVKLTQPFRSLYQYQNVMYLAAGYAVGKASQSTWEDFTQKRIFEPLGMTGANFSSTVAEKAPDHATPHKKLKDERVETTAWRNLDNAGPAGSINSGVRDLSKWLRFQLGDGTFEGKRLLSAKQLEETKSPQMVIPMDGPTGVPSFAKSRNPETNLMCYGLGWVLQDYRGQLMISHGGSIDGFRSQVALFPKQKVAVAILSNLGGTAFPEAVRNSLADHLLGGEKRDWNSFLQAQLKKTEETNKKREEDFEAKQHKNTKPSRDRAAYAGSYEAVGYGEAHVSIENGGLAFQWSRFTVPLEHFHFDTFRIKELAEDHPLRKEVVQFSLAPDGDVAALTFAGQEFRKRKGK